MIDFRLVECHWVSALCQRAYYRNPRAWFQAFPDFGEQDLTYCDLAGSPMLERDPATTWAWYKYWFGTFGCRGSRSPRRAALTCTGGQSPMQGTSISGICASGLQVGVNNLRLA